ncbi:hypothetical protein BDZ97DRAFT_799681 [Flammula alnicola]|nr:hypothetical protein BDZ97DRAFT_799681 [Flammula alnicola]
MVCPHPDSWESHFIDARECLPGVIRSRYPAGHEPSHLTSLQLTGRFLPCSQFLVHISAPPLRSFDIHIYHVDFRGSTSDNLLDNILDHLTRQKQIASPPSLRAIINRRCIHITDSRPEANADCLFRIHLEYGRTKFEFYDYLISLIELESLAHIDNPGWRFPLFMVQSLITLMAPYASIQTIKINFELSAKFLFPLLSGFGPAGSARFPLSLRHIQHMTIYDMNWHSGSLDSLSKFVTWRANSGAPLECLRFKYPDYSSTVSMPDECARLQPFCAKLVWEGGRNQHRNRRRNTSELDTDDSMNEALFGEDGSDF